MKRSSDFLLREVAGTLVIVPVGAAVSTFPGMITLNATGAYLWEQLETEQTEQTLAQALTDCYEVTQEKALEDVKAFVARLRPTGAIV
ncbi:MAG: PqqD family protein [Oscillospiraceae bacterium]|nr:PqqD family protein [Oscillospiraceae bacterium]